jgi:hypothetical protein
MEESVQNEAKGHSSKVEHFAAASLCFENQYWEQGLILLYSLIDATAWLWRDPSHGDVTGQDFRDWADRYMLSAAGAWASASFSIGVRGSARS